MLHVYKFEPMGPHDPSRRIITSQTLYGTPCECGWGRSIIHHIWGMFFGCCGSKRSNTVLYGINCTKGTNNALDHLFFVFISEGKTYTDVNPRCIVQRAPNSEEYEFPFKRHYSTISRRQYMTEKTIFLSSSYLDQFTKLYNRQIFFRPAQWKHAVQSPMINISAATSHQFVEKGPPSPLPIASIYSDGLECFYCCVGSNTKLESPYWRPCSFWRRGFHFRFLFWWYGGGWVGASPCQLPYCCQRALE